MASATSRWGSPEEEVITPPGLGEQHLAGPGVCPPGEDSPEVAAAAPLGAVRTSRQAQPGQVAPVAEGGK